MVALVITIAATLTWADCNGLTQLWKSSNQHEDNGPVHHREGASDTDLLWVARAGFLEQF